MRRHMWLLFVALATSAGARGHALPTTTPQTPASGRAPSALARILRDTTLGNGLQVISIENHTVPLATVEVVVRTGAFTQDPGTEGVPHLFEHILFRSYSGVNNASFAASASELDAVHNGRTQEEAVMYYMTLPSVFVERALGLMAQLVRDPPLTGQALDEERGIVLNEFARDRSNPEYRLDIAVGRELWGAGWGRKNALGEAASINAATAKLLREIYHRYYVPNNAAVFVTGDIVPAQVFRWTQQHFGGWERRPDPFDAYPIPPPPPLARSSVVIVEDDVHAVTVRVDWQGPSATRSRADTYTADVLGSLVNAPASGVQRHLVDSGLFTSVSLSYLTLANVGPMTLRATTTIDSLPHALAALGRELATWDQQDMFSDDELANGKRARAVAAAFELDHPTDIAQTIGFWWSVTGLDYYRDYVERMASVTRRDLHRYARRYICTAPAVVSVLIPKGARPQVERSVDSFLDRWRDSTAADRAITQ